MGLGKNNLQCKSYISPIDAALFMSLFYNSPKGQSFACLRSVIDDCMLLKSKNMGDSQKIIEIAMHHPVITGVYPMKPDFDIVNGYCVED